MGYRTSSARRSAAQSTKASSIVVLPSLDGTGPTLSGSGISATTPIKTQVVTVGSTTAASTTVASGLKITNVYVTDSSYNILDDTALDPAGGYLKIVGTGFLSGCAAYINGSALTTSFVSSTEVRVVVPASSVGTYSLMLFNTDGNGAIYLNLGVSNLPTFTTSAGSLGSIYETTGFTQSVSASGDSPFTYSLYSGSLPPGATLNSNGTITGTSQTESGSSTYSFVINVKDAQGQDTTRSFSLTINTDVVSWSSPTNNTLYSVDGGTAIANVTLSATSAAGYGVQYTANTLPTGLSLNNGVISGTPTTEQTINTLLTATANTTGRSSTRYISWSVSFADPYFRHNTLLLSTTNYNSSSNNNIFVDSSGSNIPITRNGNPTQGTLSPYGDNWSNYITSGNYVSTGRTYSFTGDFTIEAWVYFIGSSWTNYAGIVSHASGTGVLAPIYVLNTGALEAGNWGIAGYVTSSGTLTLNAWNHVALVRSGSTVRFFINGNRDSNTGSAAGTLTTGTLSLGVTSVATWNGYISNVRILNGTALYTDATYTVPTAPLTAIANTHLLTAQSQSFIDKSPLKASMTTSGSPSVQKFSPFSTVTVPKYYSTYFNGSADYLTTPVNTAFAFGTGDYTIEAWLYVTTTGTQRTVFVSGTGNNVGNWAGYFGSSDTFDIYNNGVGPAKFSQSYTTPTNTWFHFAVTRSSGTTRVFKDGVLQGSAATDSFNYASTTGNAVIGQDGIGGYFFPGLISNFRVIKGQALYTGNFTPSTTTLTVNSVGTSGANVAASITGTVSLLTCQNNTFNDNSTNNFSITSGTTTVRPLAVSPFTTTASSPTVYSPTTFGGSMYFDGTGDYLSGSSDISCSGNFTLECWVYKLSSPGADIFKFGSEAAGRVSVGVDSSNNFFFNPYGSTNSNFGTVGNNAWYHLALVRNGSTINGYINGVYSGTATNSSTFGNSGGFSIGPSHNGYISDLRLFRGTALYTSNFFPPSAPATPGITGPYGGLLTSANTANSILLVTGTNAAIIDQSRTVDLETVGDVQLSNTSPYAAGGKSLYFDGTGDYITIPSSQFHNFAFNVGDFTIECWINPSSFSGDKVIVSSYATWATSVNFYFGTRAGSPNILIFRGGDSTPISLNGNTALTAGQWVHVAVSRSSGVTRMFVGGVLQSATHTGTVNISNTVRPLVIGSDDAGAPAELFVGNIADLRITRGYARYTTTFTPPTTPVQTK